MQERKASRLPSSDPHPGLRAAVVSSDETERWNAREALNAFTELVWVDEGLAQRPQGLWIGDAKTDVVFVVLPAKHARSSAPPWTLIAQNSPCIVIVSDDREAACTAFEAGAFDFLLSPLKKERVSLCLNRIRRFLAELQPPTRSDHRPPDPHRRIIARHNQGMSVLRTEQIEWVEAARNYVVVQVAQKSYVLRETLTQFERRLPQRRFLRINRSTLVNIELISELRPNDHGAYEVVLAPGKMFPLKRAIREVQKQLETA